MFKNFGTTPQTMTQSWISGLPGHENVCFVHVRGSTLATKGHYTFSLLRYPEVKDPSHPFPGRSILDLGFTCLEGHTFYYSYTGFKASMAHEVGATPLMETIRSLLETHKGSSTTYDLLTSQIFILTRAFMNDTLCTAAMVEALLGFASAFLATHVMSPILLSDQDTFLCMQTMILPAAVMPRKMLAVVKGNPLRYWALGGEMMDDLENATRGVRVSVEESYGLFRLESVVSYREQFTLQIDTLSLDDAMTSGRIQPMPLSRA